MQNVLDFLNNLLLDLNNPFGVCVYNIKNQLTMCLQPIYNRATIPPARLTTTKHLAHFRWGGWRRRSMGGLRASMQTPMVGDGF